MSREAAAGRGRPLHQFDVEGTEQHGVNQPDQPPGSAAHPVDPYLLVHPAARRRDPVADDDPLRRRGVILIILDQPVNQGQPAVLRGGEVDQLALVFSPEGAGDGQQVDRFNQPSLALRVLPEVDRNARRYLQVHFDQVAKIAQPQAGEAHLLLFPQFLFLELPLGEYDAGAEKHIGHYVVFFFGLLPTLQERRKQLLSLTVREFTLFQFSQKFIPAFLQHRIPRRVRPSSQIRYALFLYSSQRISILASVAASRFLSKGANRVSKVFSRP